MNWTQVGISGVLNAGANALRGIDSVQLPFIGQSDGLMGGLLQGVVSGALYQIVAPLWLTDVLVIEAYGSSKGYDKAVAEALKFQAPLMLGGSGLIAQLTTTKILAAQNTSTAADALQGAIVHPVAQFLAPQPKP